MEPPKPLLMQLKEALVDAMKKQDTDAKDALRVLIGNIQTAQTKGVVSEEQIVKQIKMVISQNEEEIDSRTPYFMAHHDSGPPIYGEVIAKLKNQNVCLKKFLPVFLSQEQILGTLTTEESLQKIYSAKTDGAATGVAMGILKSSPVFAGMGIDGKLVKDVVNSIWAMRPKQE